MITVGLPRHRTLALLAVLLLWSGAAGCCQKPPPASHAPQLAATLPRAVRSAEPASALPPALPLFAAELQHPWNRVHQVLFAPTTQVSAAECLTTASCDEASAPGGVLGAVVSLPAEYADTPTQLLHPGVDLLLTDARLPQAVQALKDALAVTAESRPVAAALLQSDLWERFDAIEHALADPDRDPPARAALRQLRDGIGALIYHLALPAAVIRAIPPNLPLLVKEHPDILAGLDLSSPSPAAPWVEVMTRSAERPRSFNPTLRDGTRHAMIAGYRTVFRVFVAIPKEQGGARWLESQLAQHPESLPLPDGARLMLGAQPLLISRVIRWSKRAPCGHPPRQGSGRCDG